MDAPMPLSIARSMSQRSGGDPFWGAQSDTFPFSRPTLNSNSDSAKDSAFPNEKQGFDFGIPTRNNKGLRLSNGNGYGYGGNGGNINSLNLTVPPLSPLPPAARNYDYSPGKSPAGSAFKLFPGHQKGNSRDLGRQASPRDF
jgi:hypothetical protein